MAAILLLAPAWCRPAVAHRAVEVPGLAVVGLAPAGAASFPVIRRHVGDGWSRASASLDHGRTVAALGLGLLSLLGLAFWAALLAVLAAPPSLARRRHVISLRAPPLLLAI